MAPIEVKIHPNGSGGILTIRGNPKEWFNKQQDAEAKLQKLLRIYPGQDPNRIAEIREAIKVLPKE
jgi:hypothetical protein